MSPKTDIARRRAIWECITPISFMFSGLAGIASSSIGIQGTLCVMAVTLVVTAIVGRIVMIRH